VYFNPTLTLVDDLAKVIDPPDTVLSGCVAPFARTDTVCPSR